MTGNIFLRTSVLFLICGMAFGAYMGGTHDFTFAPVHAHNNLIGGVLMFLAGLYYNAHPQLSPKLVAAHYFIALLGVLLIVPGIYASIAQLPWAAPVVGSGSLITLISMIFFAYMVFKGTGKKAA
jgi:hypothetical protein